MLTDDNQLTSSVIARSVGVDDARGILLAKVKLNAIDTELASHCMVGDGISDAPVLTSQASGLRWRSRPRGGD